jgi:alpha-L-rhamnosidase
VDFHAYLEADNKKGYYVSLAHGWSSGPAAWLLEQVRRIEPTAAGFREVTIRPELAGLQFAHGAEPTPRWLLKVDVTPTVKIHLPPGTRAHVSLLFSEISKSIQAEGVLPEQGVTHATLRASVVLTKAGDDTFTGTPLRDEDK